MTPSRMVKPLIGMVLGPVVVWAMWLNASEPLFVRPYGQPALALRVEPASSLAGSRFDQAHVIKNAKTEHIKVIAR